MHLLTRRSLLIAALILVAGAAFLPGRYFVVVAGCGFLGAVLLVWFLQIRTGGNRRAWIDLLKSLLLDW